MLKALEISGFKSFADKTRFEFPDGITVVVGPNGSGKSNIVDAIKWVLGEQSAKSLRGKDMSDVIFKGSTGVGARKPSGSATATLILDNSSRRIPFDADEVHLGRRVFRSGETEYLINGETARLKDIKNLLRGTGIGTDAYSLIEQGKVDRLLQASTKDRRAIFEEAAGISRFKAKKTEATRRLARVEESLIRLADIVDEVGSRYRSVKNQASKAARYKEYSERLQQLRTFVGMKDWRSFSEKLERQVEESEATQAKLQQLQESMGQAEATLTQTETELDEISGRFESVQESAASEREKIAQVESRISLNESRLADITSRGERFAGQLERTRQRAEEAQQRLQETEQEAARAETARLEVQQEFDQRVQLQEGLDVEIQQAREASRHEENQQSELAKLIGELGRLVSGAESQVGTLSASRDRYLEDVATLSELAEQKKNKFDLMVQQEQELNQQAAATDSNLAQSQARLSELETELQLAKDRLTEQVNIQTGISQRASVIEELEKKLEGINAGAKELLQMSRTDQEDIDVVGLVADLISVNVQHAAIVDAALGDFSQYVVVRSDRIIRAVAAEQLKVEGRVGVLPLDAFDTLNADPGLELAISQGVIGRAMELVTAAPEYRDLVYRLLGGTWVVKTLDDALRIHRAGKPDVRFVTLDGEVVESDGTVMIGPKSTAVGLVSRRSELRALKRQLLELDQKIPETRLEIENSEKQVRRYRSRCDELLKENSELARKLATLESSTKALRSELASISERLTQSKSDLEKTTTRLNSLDQQLLLDRSKLEQTETEVASLVESLGLSRDRLENLAQQRADHEDKMTGLKVQLAKLDQARETEQERLAQLKNDLASAQQALEDIHLQIENDKSASAQAEEELAEAKKLLESLNEQRAQTNQQLEELSHRKHSLDEQRKTESSELRIRRDESRKLKDSEYQLQLQVEQLKAQRQQLAERLQEDYQIDIASVESVDLSEEELAQRDAVDDEIATLRQQLKSIGSVNVDALQELEELEERYLHMDEQYRDLVQAKESLEKIIVRIDADSRRLFVETLEAIRANFQTLFRQTFGGGQADIIMEEGVDPLEAGVEILATPPGKPQVSNSLLSGGEKALTAVSLLMAIFQFRPSPFCILDEVDAPFDEANIGRFIDVLRSFLGWTKFVIVTHSKKTMTAATTLYGVTMQESGVSKRVSVRFEDVSEDGNISKEAIDRDDEAA